MSYLLTASVLSLVHLDLTGESNTIGTSIPEVVDPWDTTLSICILSGGSDRPGALGGIGGGFMIDFSIE